MIVIVWMGLLRLGTLCRIEGRGGPTNQIFVEMEKGDSRSWAYPLLRHGFWILASWSL